MTGNLEKSDNVSKNVKHISAKILKLMDDNNVSFTDLANATGLSAEAIKKIVQGKIKNPGIDTLTKIADAFSLTIFDLLNDTVRFKYFHETEIKVIDSLDLAKCSSQEDMNKLLEQSGEIIIVSTCVTHAEQIFAIKVTANLADKLNSSGMLVVKEGDVLVFEKYSNHLTDNAIVIANIAGNISVIGLVLENATHTEQLFIKSIDSPFKQTIQTISRQAILACLSSIQFN